MIESKRSKNETVPVDSAYPYLWSYFRTSMLSERTLAIRRRYKKTLSNL